MTGLARDIRVFARSTRYDGSAAWLGRWPEAGLLSLHPAISIATEANDLNEVGRLRYELYIARDGKTYRNADHTHQTFIEPVDAVSLNIQARIGDELLAAVRLVRADDALLDPHLRLLVEAYQPVRIESTVICSRFAVRPEHRARALITPLFVTAYCAALIFGADHCVLETRSELRGIFRRFGFRETGKTVCDPISGIMNVLDVNLRQIGDAQEVAPSLRKLASSLAESQETLEKEVA